MKAWLSWAVLFLCLGGAQSAAVAQKTPAQQTVAVVVVDAHTEPAQPVPTVRVALGYLDGTLLVTDARDVTNPRGQAWLDVSEDTAQRGNLRIEITGATNLVIYQPADGQVTVPPTAFTVKMLPKGSPELLGPAQIEAMLHRMSLEIAGLEKKNSALQSQANTTQQQKPDLGAAIAAWAFADGFSADKVNQQVEQWAQGIQKQPNQATAGQKALAELALKHYAIAAQFFTEAGEADKQQLSDENAQEQALEAQAKALQAAQQALFDKARASLRQLLDHSQQAAGAYQLNLQYHQATQTLESAEADAQAEYKRHTDDRGLHELWLEAISNATIARRKEGEVAPADRSLTLLAQAAEDFELLSRDYTTMGDRQAAAEAQDGSGDALADAGTRASAEKAMALLDQSVEAYHSALKVYTKAELPRDWAKTQNDLGFALMREGERATGDQAMALLDQAAEAFRNALEVDTKADLPQDWALTQIGLGLTLAKKGERATSDKSIALLDESVDAYRNALTVYTEADQPQDWARTQMDLGNALLRESWSAPDDKATALLDQTVQAYRNALEVYTKAGLPQNWAMTQNDLGIALESESERSKGEKAEALLDQAVNAFRNALEVYTKAGLPQSWAAVQSDLGSTLAREGERATGDKAKALLDQAAQAFRSALEVDTKADLPQSWAMMQLNLGSALVDEGELATGDEAKALFDQAVEAYRNALTVYTEADLPQDWAMTQDSLGNALRDEGERATGDKAVALFDQAVQAFQHALEVRTKADLPQYWAQAQASLEGLYHDQTFQFADALKIEKELADFDPSIDNRVSLLEAELTGADFNDCAQLAARLDDTAIAQKKPYTSVRDVIGLACQWGAADKAGAVATNRRLLAKTDAERSLTPGGWSFTGTLRFLSESQAFATGRSSWIALFTAVQNGDSAGMTAALHQLEPLLQQ